MLKRSLSRKVFVARGSDARLKRLQRERGEPGYVSEYIDYPDEKVKWTRFFEVPPHNVGKAKNHKELMLRPEYPAICNEKKIPSVISEVTVIVNDSWKVGDLVDWWSNECYWSGKITQLCGNDKGEVALTGPPLGEGDVYDILLKDIRPSLNWSLENGWTLPTQEGKTGRPCARLIKPTNQATPTPSINSADIKEPPILDKHEVTDPHQRTAGKSVKLPLSSSAKVSKKQQKDDTKEKRVRKRNNVENSTSLAEPAAVEVAEGLNSGCSVKKKSKCIERKGAAALNSVRSDTLETQVELEIDEGNTRRPCARLVKPISEATDPRRRTAGQSVKLPLSSSVPSSSAKASKKQVKDDNVEEKSVRKRNNVENSTSSADQPAAVEVAEDLNSGCSVKKKSKCIESKGGATLNSARSDTLEAAVMDLEEYVNKVKWLKQILHHGISSSDDDASKSRWEVVDTTASENPKLMCKNFR